MKPHSVSRIYLRFHARLILAIVALSGFSASHLLLKHSRLDIAIRYSVAALVSYLVFIFMMFLWKIYLEGLPPIQSKPEIRSDDSTDHKDRKWSDYIDIPDFTADWDDLFIGVFVLVAFFILVFGSTYIMIEIPALMIEVVLSSLASTIFYKSIRKADDHMFVFKVVRHTIMPGLAIIFISLIIGMGISRFCPMATKMADLFSGICGG